MKKDKEREELTRADIMERMHECWEKLRFDRKLTKREEDVIGYNFNLIQFYIKLNPTPYEGEHTFACGFEYEEDESEDEYEE